MKLQFILHTFYEKLKNIYGESHGCSLNLLRADGTEENGFSACFCDCERVWYIWQLQSFGFMRRERKTRQQLAHAAEWGRQ